jgi:hypothetical protein
MSINPVNMRIFLFFVFFILVYHSANSQVTTFAGSYGMRGGNVNQIEYQFSIETTYKLKQRCAQLYRWRYAVGDFSGLMFEYNNRFYFGSKRKMDNSKWFFEGKLGHGVLKGRNYSPGFIKIFEANELIYENDIILKDKTHYIFNYGISMGYKWVLAELIMMDFNMGYVGYSSPNFSSYSVQHRQQREADWKGGMGSNFEFQWSIGFLLK